ncbi:MAG: AraC family transcriptional regulator [Ruminococcus sp.]|nr:AraC family transcriptional regulator [Ruminococcus sp.]
MEITENNKLEMYNVFSYRGTVTQQQLNNVSLEIEEILNSSGARKVGSPVSATFSMSTNAGEQVMDVELLIPIDREIQVPYGYTFKPIFRLNNAVKIRHKGNPALMQQSMNELLKYINEKKLSVATSAYVVTITDPKILGSMDEFISEIYVGVNDNIL